MHFIGLDVGTTGCKAMVFDAAGNAKGSGFRECAVICTEPKMGEQDAELVWLAAKEVIRKAVAEAGASDIAAISLSVQGDAIIPVDKSFRALCPAILGMDYRSEREARELADKIGDRALFEQTGMRPHPMNSAVKMLWLKHARPEVFDRAWTITTYADYITGKLCGEAVIDYTMASRTMCFETPRRRWSPGILAAIGLDESRLSVARQSGEVVGTILPHVAVETGLSNQVKVVTGGHDQTCAALGAGVIGTGRAVLSCGTAEVLATSFARAASPTALYESYYPCYLSAIRDMYFTFSLLHVGGIVLKWYRDNLAAAEVAKARESGRDPFDEIVDAMPAGPSPVMALPHFNGSGTPVCDMASKGAFVGLTMSTTRHDMAKAILEGLAFEHRINLDRLQECGVPVAELAAVGGGARSARGLQMKADIIGRPIMTLQMREAACLGAALLAATATGAYRTIQEAVAATVKPARTYVPDPGVQAAYSERFAIYRDLYPALRPLSARL